MATPSNQPQRRTPGGGAELTADLLEHLTGLVVELGGEGAAAHRGKVGLDHAEHLIDGARRDAGTHTGAPGRRRRAGDEGVDAPVDAAAHAELPLEEDALARLDGGAHGGLGNR